MEQAIKYWECPQNPDHVFDYDDPRIERFDLKDRARCPRDNRAMEPRYARVGQRQCQ